MVNINMEKYSFEMIPQKRNHYLRINDDREYFLQKEDHLFNNYSNEYCSYLDIEKEMKSDILTNQMFQKDIKKLKKKLKNYKYYCNKNNKEMDPNYIKELEDEVKDIEEIIDNKYLKNTEKKEDFSSFVISFSDKTIKENIAKNNNFREDLINKMEEFVNIFCEKYNLKKVSLALHADEGAEVNGEIQHNIHFHLLTYRRKKDLKLVTFNKTDLSNWHTMLAEHFKVFGFRRGKKNNVAIHSTEKEWRQETKRKYIKRLRKVFNTEKDTLLSLKEYDDKAEKIEDRLLSLMFNLSSANYEETIKQVNNILYEVRQYKNKRMSSKLEKKVLKYRKVMEKQVDKLDEIRIKDDTILRLTNAKQQEEMIEKIRIKQYANKVKREKTTKEIKEIKVPTLKEQVSSTYRRIDEKLKNPHILTPENK